MARRFCNSIELFTYRANGDQIDVQSYDGTVGAAQNIADDIANFEDVWEVGESYRLLVNGTEVENVECADPEPDFDPENIYGRASIRQSIEADRR